VVQQRSPRTLYIEPGSPWENGYCELFNSKRRDEFLNGEIFNSIKELRVLAERWRVHYNTVRSHSSLGYLPPAPEAWPNTELVGYGEVESKQRFPLHHTPDDGGYLNSTITNSSPAQNIGHASLNRLQHKGLIDRMDVLAEPIWLRNFGISEEVVSLQLIHDRPVGAHLVEGAAEGKREGA